MLRGSYHNGFAPRDGMPLYPSLWRGCVGAWAPCLGPTGTTLRDWSAYKNHGTLTNMDPATDWVVNGASYCLDFDNTDDYIDCGTNSLFGFTGPFSVSCWFRTFVVFDYVVFASKHAGATGWIVGCSSSKVFCQINSTFNANGSTPAVNTWTHFAGTYDGVTIRCYMNAGTPDTIASSAPTANATAMRIGAYSTTATAPMNGQLDDVRLYNRCLNPNEIAILARRRGIAYDLAPMPMPYSEQVDGFQAAWALRQRLILGGGGGMG